MSGGLHLFEGFGIELEYMIVDRDSLDVRPLADRVLEAAAGRIESEVEMGRLAWSNELVLHVVELKTNGPAPALDGLAAAFQSDVQRIDSILAPLGARLMPTGMHPWMDPRRETRLWPHEYSPVYEAFDRIFSCTGHGWSNLQSAHLNLPFQDDEEFGRLHAAIRLVLPILPALAASSPVIDGRRSGFLDHRLEVYRSNAARIPSVAGAVIPEPAYTRRAYETDILERIYRDLEPHDPDGVLRHEWVNSRGAIARFDRDAIEIRVLDVQECPEADLAIAAVIVAVLRACVEERWLGREAQQASPQGPLADIFLRTIRDGDAARLEDLDYLAAFGMRAPCTAGDLWRHLVTMLLPEHPPALDVVLAHGPVARRIGRGLDAGRPLAEVYRDLCDCLHEGKPYIPA
jgi:gamma-glutamyl:cysteine ligase YbdK (ATP-grasp superfamily)